MTRRIYFRGNWLVRSYRIFNSCYFGSRLPEDMELSWARLKADMGYCDSTEIVLDRRLKRWPRVALSTLLHEMAHLSSGAAGHGPKFQKEMLRLAKVGAFKDIW